MRTPTLSLPLSIICGLWLFNIGSVSAEVQFGDEVLNRTGRADAMSISARLLGRPLALEDRGPVLEPSNNVLTLQELGESARNLGFASREVRLHTRSPKLAHRPLIVKLRIPDGTTGESRFVVLFGMVKGNRVQMIDYPLPPQLVPVSVLAESWDGHGLYLSTSEATLPTPNSWFDANSPMRILALSVFALAVSVASTLYWWIRERRQRNTQS